MRRLCRRALFCACPKRSDQHFDAFSDLQEILREAGQDAEFLQQLETELGAFTARMPHELDALVTDLESVRGGDGCRGSLPPASSPVSGSLRSSRRAEKRSAFRRKLTGWRKALRFSALRATTNTRSGQNDGTKARILNRCAAATWPVCWHGSRPRCSRGWRVGNSRASAPTRTPALPQVQRYAA